MCPTTDLSASSTAELTHRLQRVVRGEVSSSPGRRAQYSSDASNYRVPPEVVVFPHDSDELEAVSSVARELAVPLTLRGGGTSIAGNSIGSGIVVDTSRAMHRILEIDPESRTARVQPGVVLATLQRAAAAHGLRFGPDPSTQSRATLGGMIGNNACGPRALAHGRTSDNVVSLEVVDGTGKRFVAGGGLDPVPGLADLVASNLETFRVELGRLGRQVSGYSLEHLLPENGGNLARALVGTEGTVVSVLEATVNLVEVSPALAMVVLGYPDMASAADAVPALLAHRPLAIEGMDARLVDLVRQHRGSSLPELPVGAGWLLVEIGGQSVGEARANAARLIKDAGTRSVRMIPIGSESAALWRIREDGAGLGGRTPRGRQAWPGWEDAAVPPERLGSYLRDFESLMADHGVEGLPYGHFGDGCIHVRIDIPMERDGSSLREFVTDAAALVVSHGGSLSGEHGDGRARSELLKLMYSDGARAAFAAFKHLLDPTNILNPGIIVDPAPLDADLRRPQALPLMRKSGFSFGHDEHDFAKAVHRCVGVGKCRADNGDAGGFMCPSYLATGDENDVTRGRARVLQEMINGSVVKAGWSSPEVHDALELCLGCKACSKDCPSGVDMAQYKSEVLYRSFEGKLRPASHYALGWLPRWAKLVAFMPRVVNRLIQTSWISAVVLRLGGMDSRRKIPLFAEQAFLRTQRRHPTPERPGGEARVQRGQVVLWVDSFADAFSPSIPSAAMRILEDAGFDVVIPDQAACCAITWISTGQLGAAKTRLSRLLDVMAPYALAGVPIIGLEPSCTAVVRSDLLDLLPEDPRSSVVSAATMTLAEFLGSPFASHWTPPDLSGVTAIVQPHCHHYSVMNFDADLGLLRQAGATVSSLAGCCGLAGNFGMEKGHYETSVAVAENALLPALRGASEGAIFLADGFSCRTQAEQLAGVAGISLAELLASRLLLRAGASSSPPEG